MVDDVAHKKCKRQEFKGMQELMHHQLFILED